ncbi:MAG: DUF5320 domain-containing protein [Victivallaceae bacterium]|nr:DUF5320 domain-containing protein [Victivallaceae bacterium]
MPRGDGTGPLGAGPMTGRAAGCCAGFSTPGFAGFAGYGRSGRGTGMGRAVRGRGLGFRNRFYAPVPVQPPEFSAEQEKEYLVNEVKALETELEAVKKRLDGLGK